VADDWELLGLEAGADAAALKAAYRARAKALHPDTSPPEEALANHLRFIAVRQAYDRLSRRLAAAAPRPSPAPRVSPAQRQPAAQRPAPAASRPAPAPAAARPAAAPAAGRAVAVPADQAYALYKAGIAHFARIHPSAWNEGESRLKTPIPGDGAEMYRLRRRVLTLIGDFPRAYQYFSQVASDYPDSPWAADSLDKLGRIEAMTARYRQIIESFTAWASDGPEAAERQRASHRRHRENYAGFPGRDRRDWER
jgi:TolA-binding protein